MNTPDAYIQKNASQIMNMMGCGASGFNPGFSLRRSDRKLGDAYIHRRTSSGIYGTTPGLELTADLLFSPFLGDVTELEDMFFAQHILGYFTGLYGEDLYSVKLPCAFTANVNNGEYTIVNDMAGAIPYPIADIATVPAGLVRNVVLWDADSGANVLNDDNATAFGTTTLSNRMMHWSGQREIPYFPIDNGPTNRLIPGTVLASKGGLQTYSGNTTASAFLGAAGDYALNWFDKINAPPTGDNSQLFTPELMGLNTRFSSVRTFYYYFRSLDGDDSRVTITNVIHPLFMPASNYHCPEIFNFRTETVGTMSDTNGTTFDLIPGHRHTYQVWRVFENNGYDDAFADLFATPGSYTAGVPSLCASFGTGGVASVLGSNVPGLVGFADYDSLATTLGTTSDVLFNEGQFVNGEWLRYLETRLGGLASHTSSYGAGNTLTATANRGESAEPADILRWRSADAGLLCYDQDILDTSEGLLGALLYLTFGVSHPGMMTFAATLKSDGSVGAELRGSYGWGDASSMVTEDFMATESSTGDVEPLH